MCVCEVAIHELRNVDHQGVALDRGTMDILCATLGLRAHSADEQSRASASDAECKERAQLGVVQGAEAMRVVGATEQQGTRDGRQRGADRAGARTALPYTKPVDDWVNDCSRNVMCACVAKMGFFWCLWKRRVRDR